MLKYTFILLLLFSTSFCFAQNIYLGTFNSGVSQTKSSGAKYDFAIGYMFNAVNSKKIDATPLVPNTNFSKQKTEKRTFNFEAVIYPNPTKDIAYISLPNYMMKSIKIVTVYDILGKQVLAVKNHSLLEGKYCLDLQSLKNGRYIVNLMFKDAQVPSKSFKIVKF